MMRGALKACPGCGKVGSSLVMVPMGLTSTADHGEFEETPPGAHLCVKCLNCGMQGPEASIKNVHGASSQAIVLWNKLPRRDA